MKDESLLDWVKRGHNERWLTGEEVGRGLDMAAQALRDRIDQELARIETCPDHGVAFIGYCPDCFPEEGMNRDEAEARAYFGTRQVPQRIRNEMPIGYSEDEEFDKLPPPAAKGVVEGMVHATDQWYAAKGVTATVKDTTTSTRGLNLEFNTDVKIQTLGSHGIRLHGMSRAQIRALGTAIIEAADIHAHQCGHDE
jgi:hypothetical protein